MSIRVSNSSSSSNGTLTIDDDHIFDTTDARDTYFTTNSGELVSGLYCSVDGTLYKYSGSTWTDCSTVIQGSTGETGADGEDGTDGVGFYPQFSTDGSSWHNTFVSGDDLYIRTVTVASDGTESYADGTEFIGTDGSDGKDVTAQYSTDGTTWHSTFSSDDDKYIRFTDDGGTTYTDSARFVGYSLEIQYSESGDSDWHDTLTDDDMYWRWSTDGGDTYSDDFVRYKTTSDVDVATSSSTGVVQPDGTTIVIDEDGVISAEVAAATKTVCDSETEMLALDEISNLYIVTRTDTETIWYLNADTDPSDIDNWIEGASVADTVASFTGANADTRTGAVVAEEGDYTQDMIDTVDITTGTTYYLQADDGALYLVERQNGKW